MRRTAILGAAVLALCLLLAAAAAEIHLGEQPPEDWADRPLLRLTAFPTVTNDAALLEVGGLTMLIDGGTKGWTADMRASLTEMGCGDRVDVIFNTHPHEDHIGCVINLVKQGFRAGAFWSTFPRDYDDDRQREAVEVIDGAGIPWRTLANGEEVDFGGAHLVFWYFPEGRDPNALSAMTHITFGEATMLLTADASTGAQDYFHRTLGAAMRADILKIPHHGYTASRPAFLDDAAPGFAYITSRRAMTEKANTQLRRRGIPFLHTSVGPVTMVTDGTDWYIWQENRPY